MGLWIRAWGALMFSGIEWLVGLWRGRAREVALAYHRLLGTEQGDGRMVLADLAHLCHAAGDPFVPGQTDLTAFRLGQRSVWLHIQHMLDIPPERIPEIMNEANGERG